VDKFRSALERSYASIGVGIIRVVEEIQRVRNWDSSTRTTVILSVSSLAPFVFPLRYL